MCTMIPSTIGRRHYDKADHMSIPSIMGKRHYDKADHMPIPSTMGKGNYVIVSLPHGARN